MADIGSGLQIICHEDCLDAVLFYLTTLAQKVHDIVAILVMSTELFHRYTARHGPLIFRGGA